MHKRERYEQIEGGAHALREPIGSANIGDRPVAALHESCDLQRFEIVELIDFQVRTGTTFYATSILVTRRFPRTRHESYRRASRFQAGDT